MTMDLRTTSPIRDDNATLRRRWTTVARRAGGDHVRGEAAALFRTGHLHLGARLHHDPTFGGAGGRRARGGYRARGRSVMARSGWRPEAVTASARPADVAAHAVLRRVADGGGLPGKALRSRVAGRARVRVPPPRVTRCCQAEHCASWAKDDGDERALAPGASGDARRAEVTQRGSGGDDAAGLQLTAARAVAESELVLRFNCRAPVPFSSPVIEIVSRKGVELVPVPT